MGTGCGVQLHVEGRAYNLFCHYRGDRDFIGKELLLFCNRLSDQKWASLEQKLRLETTWVHEDDFISTTLNNQTKKSYEKKFKDQTRNKAPEQMKHLLGRISSHPAYALSMISKGSLQHMMHWKDSEAKQSEIFDHAEFWYRINFRTRTFKVLEEGKWVNMPMCHGSWIKVISQFCLRENNQAALDRIAKGPEP
ncbi:hypothetical protein EJ07DRAFT_156474 [Lizonia empirigonia]|nr:hypothetical protein EJ07DRAFT_156474 [Lizonia empirigonia]